MDCVLDTAAAIVLVHSLSSVGECEACALLRSKVLGRLYESDVGHVLVDSVVNLNQLSCCCVGRVASTVSGVGCVSDGCDCLVDVSGWYRLGLQRFG